MSRAPFPPIELPERLGMEEDKWSSMKDTYFLTQARLQPVISIKDCVVS